MEKYSECEVNEILKPIYDDYMTIRRYLIMYGFMERTRDGRQYWLTNWEEEEMKPIIEEHDLYVVEYLSESFDFAICSPRTAFKSDTIIDAESIIVKQNFITITGSFLLFYIFFICPAAEKKKPLNRQTKIRYFKNIFSIYSSLRMFALENPMLLLFP